MELRPDGRLKIFKKPDPQMLYACGCDVAQGLIDGDYSTICVLDKNFEQAAQWHGHIDPDLLGGILCRVGEYYNRAVIAPEINNHGYTVLTKIKNLQYPNIYTRVTTGSIGEDFTTQLGWLTSSATKMKMLDEFVASFRDGTLKLYDKDLLLEMLTLSLDDGGDVSLNGKDRVVSACIALQALKQTYSNNLRAYNQFEKGLDLQTNKISEKIKFYANRENVERNFE